MNSRHLRFYHEVAIPLSSHPGVKALRRNAPPASLHGHKVWTSTFVLIDFLRAQGISAGARVLDLGCGWGVASSFLAKVFAADVTGVDADDAVQPYFALLAQCNDVSPQFLRASFETLAPAFLAQFDIVLAADICFWDQSVAPLSQLVERSVEAGVKQIVIADPGRPPFWALADFCAETFFAEVHMHRIEKPRVATKPVLVIENA